MTNPNSNPESESQLSKAELEHAKATLEAKGAYEGRSLPERVTMTLHVARCINMGGVALVMSNGQLEKVYEPGDEGQPNEAG
jgi:hypothetical protein